MRFHLAVGLRHVGALDVGFSGRTARCTDVIVERLSGRVGHGDRRVHCALNAHHRVVARDVQRVTVLQRQVVQRSRILEYVGKLDSDATDSVPRPVEHHAVRVPIRREPAGACDEIGNFFRLGLERVSAGITNFAGDHRGALQLPVGLPQDQNVVVGLDDDLGVRTRRRGQARRAEVLPIRRALEDVARVQRNSERGSRDAASPVLRQPRNLRFIQDTRSDPSHRRAARGRGSSCLRGTGTVHSF